MSKLIREINCNADDFIDKSSLTDLKVILNNSTCVHNVWSLKAETTKLEQEKEQLKKERDEICDELRRKSKFLSKL